jgi:23S rRNA pseudoU1915 N3-methylase RlmH
VSSQSRQINNHNKNYNNIPTSSSISSSSDNILNQSEDYKLNISELKHSHRLSPISDNEPNECQINGNNKKDRIKSISPLSSSSTASSSSLSQLSAKLQLQQQQSGIVSSSSLNAVLAAAAAAGHPHPHLVAKQHHHQQQQQLHQHHQHLHPNNHAQSVAALLADIQASQHQQQQHQQHQQAAVALSHLANVNPAAAALHLSRYSNHNQSDLVAAVIAQQQQQNRAVAAALDSTNGNSNGTNNNNNNNSNGQLYSRFSHITSNRRYVNYD